VVTAERLQADSCETAMVTGAGNVNRRFRFGQGFDWFTHLGESTRRDAHPLGRAQRVALNWVDQRDPRGRSFASSTADPHDPYTPASRYRKQFAPDVTDPDRLAPVDGENSKLRRKAAALRQALMALYDGEIAQNDASFGSCSATSIGEVSATRRGALCSSPDHGKEFFDHGGWKHGLIAQGAAADPALAPARPSRRGNCRHESVEQIDVAPTLLALAGLDLPSGASGRSLVEIIEGRSRSASRTVSYAWLDTTGLDFASVVRSQ
jgi:arylsulfatase A-like enzyme